MSYREERIKARTELIEINRAEIERLIGAASADHLALAVTPWWRLLRRMALNRRRAKATALAGDLHLDNGKLFFDNYLDAHIGRMAEAIDLLLDRMGADAPQQGKTNAAAELLQLIDVRNAGEGEPR